MPDNMGTFRVDLEIENPARPGERRTLTSVLVDTGAELSWAPRDYWSHWGSSVTTNGTSDKPTGRFRALGRRRVYLRCRQTDGRRHRFRRARRPDLLGSRTLEGLNLRIEPVARRLVDAGPAPAAAAA